VNPSASNNASQDRPSADEAHDAQSHEGRRSGEGAASAMAHMISQDQQFRHPDPEAGEAQGGRQ
jgi:hypothetical protein